MRFTIPYLTLMIIVNQTHAAELTPAMVQLEQLVLDASFDQSGEPDKRHWKPRQNTRWNIGDGVLRGIPSTPGFQASQNHHQGFEPRLSIPSCPDEFAIQFSMRFTGGEGTALCPFIEFGHHVGRVYWSKDGAQLLANKESVQLDLAPDFVIEKGTWYHGLAEVKGDQLLIRFSHGPVLYGKHPSLDAKRDGFGIAGFRGGQVELDNIRVWSVGEKLSKSWITTARHLKPAPVKTLKPEIAKGL